MVSIVKTGHTRNLPAIFSFTGLILAWEMSVRFLAIPVYILPAPSRVLAALWEARSILYSHTIQTMQEAFLGLGIAILIAVFLSFWLVFSPLLKRAVYPLLVASQTIPIIALAPLLVIWFGYGMAPKVAVVALVCFFPLVISMVEGLAATDQDMVNLLKVMGASPMQIFYLVQIPAALPSIFAGMKIAATYAIMGAVIGEWLGASKGLGVFMTRAGHSFRIDHVFAAILVISALSMLIFAFVSWSGRKLTPWLQERNEKE